LAYFPNGSTGHDYEAQFCWNCIHYGPEDGPGCPVWGAHLLFNYDQLDKNGESTTDAAKILSMLIPEREDGFADECRMFVRAE
jgi:hypothetical protein